MRFGDTDEESDRPKQWAIFFRTRCEIAFPHPIKHVPVGDGQRTCLVFLDTPSYNKVEFNRCLRYLMRFFPDYEYRSGWKRHQFYEHNWNFETVWERHV